MKRNSVHCFVAITAPSLFILCLFFSEGKKKGERGVIATKKMHRVPFHHIFLTLDLTPSEEISSVLAELVDAEAGSITSRSR